MPTGQGLADLLSGAAGAPVNRPQMNAFVANSQATNSLRSAQTDEALLNAQRAQDEQTAAGQLEDAFVKSGARPADAHLMAVSARMHAGSAVNAMDMFKAYNATVLGDPTKLNTPDQTAASQAISGKLAEPVAAPNDMIVPAGVHPNVQQSPQGVAQQADTESQTALRNAQAAAGGFNPHTGAMGNVTPDHMAALQQAIADGRLDPARVNSRTAAIFGELESRNPGKTNFNRLTADAVLQRNAGFQQKAITQEALPTLMQHVTSLGKEIGYSDWRTVGKMQQFMNGETNDPKYAEYMAVRNDVLMSIANTMRGVGMSDQAHRAEIEAAAPTMSPLALDGWLKGQMSSLKPRLDQVRRVEHLGDQPNTPVGMPSTDVPAGPPPLGSTVPIPQGAPPSGLPPGLKIVN